MRRARAARPRADTYLDIRGKVFHDVWDVWVISTKLRRNMVCEIFSWSRGLLRPGGDVFQCQLMDIIGSRCAHKTSIRGSDELHSGTVTSRLVQLGEIAFLGLQYFCNTLHQ